MSVVTETTTDVSPLLIAAMMLSVRTMAAPYEELLLPSASEILRVTGAGRTRAYELASKIRQEVRKLVRPPGRPRKEAVDSEPPSTAVTEELSRQVLSWLMEHPGSVTSQGRRRRYSTAFRSYILDLVEEHRELSLGEFAQAVCVPLPTVYDWLRAGEPESDSSAANPEVSRGVSSADIATILDEWERWDGGFVPFCRHLSEHLGLPYGRTMIESVLEQYGQRTPQRRPGRSPDEQAMRQAFETFFPGAQWQGDGSPIEVRLFGQSFRFNLELMVDCHSGAVVGLSVRDAEDGEAVVEAFDQGVETTGGAPLVVELDNRPSNQGAAVHEGLGETGLLPSTPGRPQSNGYVEGAHGLFQQAAPPLELGGESPKEAARQLLELAAVIWARTLNHRPRVDRGGRSRASIYQDEPPSESQRREAEKRLGDRMRRQERARQTRGRRSDPVVRQVLDEAFERLGLDDPRGHIRSVISRYRLDDVLAGIATYEGKRKAGRLPGDAGGRYLLGIVRNVSEQDEGVRITDELLRLRVEARDQMVAHLVEARRELEAECGSFDELLRSVVGRAMDSSRQLERLFWLDVAAELIVARPEAERVGLVQRASRRIFAVFEVAYRERLRAVRHLARKVVPLE